MEQQTATSEVLQVISRSAFDLQTVLDTLVQSAARLCEADIGTITRQREGVFFREAFYGLPPEFVDYVRTIPVEPERGNVAGRALLEGKSVQIEDVDRDPDYSWDQAKRLGHFRTLLGVPLMRQGKPVGVISLGRRAVGPFTAKQIELVQTFADQAVIAIENVRLFEEVQARTAELQESLEYQTATSDVLNVISRSPSQIFSRCSIALLKPPAGSARPIDTVILLREGEWLKLAAHRRVRCPSTTIDGQSGAAGSRGAPSLDLKPIHIPDLAAAAEEFPEGHSDGAPDGCPNHACRSSAAGERGRLVPFSVRRTEVRPFSDKAGRAFFRPSPTRR